MEEQKYYTPAPEDIHIGFEFEIQDSVVTDIWRSKKIKHAYEMSFVCGSLSNIRVPYLTAEQIEAEGLTLKGSTGDIRVYELTVSGTYATFHFFPVHQLIIRRNSTHAFNGVCRCINDLRLIRKLLGI